MTGLVVAVDFIGQAVADFSNFSGQGFTNRRDCDERKGFIPLFEG
jgi:hypothetical protein